MSHKLELVELQFMGHVAGIKRYKDAMTLRVYGYATCPCCRIKIRDNDQNSLCSCIGKNKMAAISSGARAAAFDWNDLDRKRKNCLLLDDGD